MKYFILFISLVITINLNAQLFGGMAIAQPSSGYVYDIDGNPYQEVVIGAQTWLKPNLKTTRYNDGVSISNITNSNTWGNLSTGARSYYSNDSTTNAPIYGALYNWYAVNTGKLCPTGYHIPTETEWNTLISYLGGSSVAGGKLKETGTLHWASPNTGATDDFDYTALPGGFRDDLGGYYTITTQGYWWSSTSYNTGNSVYSNIGKSFADMFINNYDKNFGLSVRCLKD